jgi:hypothetical protein
LVANLRRSIAITRSVRSVVTAVVETGVEAIVALVVVASVAESAGLEEELLAASRVSDAALIRIVRHPGGMDLRERIAASVARTRIALGGIGLVAMDLAEMDHGAVGLAEIVADLGLLIGIGSHGHLCPRA